MEVKQELDCVAYAKELFDVNTLGVGLYHERLIATSLLIKGVKVEPYYQHDTKNTHALVTLTYIDVNSVVAELVSDAEKEMQLLVFSNINSISHAFSDWKDSFKYRMFKGKIPITVAIDLGKMNLHILCLNQDGSMEMYLFEELKAEQITLITEDISTDKPFRFDLTKSVLMDIISGDEGYRHAYDNLRVVFNCTTEMVVTRMESLI